MGSVDVDVYASSCKCCVHASPVMNADQQACIVSIAEGLSQFEVPFVNSVSRTISTKSLFLNEPVIYQPLHLPSPVLTHIVFIGKDHFMVGASITERMIPRSQAQRVRMTYKNRITMAPTWVISLERFPCTKSEGQRVSSVSLHVFTLATDKT